MAIHDTIQVIDQNTIDRIHETSLTILAEMGIVFHHPKAIELFQHHGLRVDGKTVYFPRPVVEKALSTCPTTFIWAGRNSEQSLEIGKMGTAFPCIGRGQTRIMAADGTRRPATIRDTNALIKLCQSSDVVRTVSSNPAEPADIEQAERHLYITYETLKNTDKPIHGYMCNEKALGQELDMVELAVGGKAAMEKNHYIAISSTPFSPLSYAPETCWCAMEFARRNQIVSIVTSPMAAITSPANLINCLVVQNAEFLSGLIMVQLTRPGAPVDYLPLANVPNMRTATCIYSSPELNLMKIAAAQVAHALYHIPVRTVSAYTEAKTLSAQAGYEAMESMLTSVFSGASMAESCMGTLENCMIFSYEKFIMDEEIYRRAQRLKEGLPVDDNAFSLDAIREVGHGGSYLEHDSIFPYFRNYWTPQVANWQPYSQWHREGEQGTVERAEEIWKERLAHAPESLIDGELDRDLQAFIRRSK